MSYVDFDSSVKIYEANLPKTPNKFEPFRIARDALDHDDAFHFFRYFFNKGEVIDGVNVLGCRVGGHLMQATLNRCLLLLLPGLV